MSRNYIYYTKSSFTGGQNDSDQIDQIKDDECVYIQNMITQGTGYLVNRGGHDYVGDTSVATNPVVGNYTFVTDAGTVIELRMETTNLQYNNAGTWTNIDTGFTTGLDTWFTQANNKVYISNGTDNTHSYDGSSVSDLGASYPKGKYSAWWKNYFFIAGDAYIGGTGYKNRVFFSNLGTPDTMTTGTDYFDVGKSDGQSITGIYPLGEFLVIFKRKSIYILSGANPDAWKLSASVNNLSTIANGIGCVSAKSIVQVGNDLWFASDDGIRSVRRNEQGSIPLMGLVSKNISGTFDTINKSAYDKICGTFFENKVYMAIPTGVSSTNNVVMVANTLITLDDQYNPHPWFTYTGWTPYVFNIHLTGNRPQLHWGDSGTTNVFQGETTNTDAVGTLDIDVKDKMFDAGVPEMKKTFRFIKIGVQGSGDYNLSTYSSTDGYTYTLRENLNLQQGNVWGTGVWDTDTWSNTSEKKFKVNLKIGSPQLQMRFTHSGDNEPVTIYPYTIAVKRKKIK